MRNDTKEAFALIGLLGASVIGAILASGVNSARTERIKASYPPEYWQARIAESEERVRKHQLDVASKERLALDKRARDDQARKQRLEFERSAPSGYWAYKAEQERLAATKDIARQKAQTEREIAKQKAQTEREVAEKKARAIENSTLKLVEAFGDDE